MTHNGTMSKSVGIIGASGLIGAKLAKEYERLGWNVRRISRRPKHILNEEWSPVEKESLRGLDILINLSGAPIAKRWTSRNKRRFYKSRVNFSQTLNSWLSELPENERPAVWLNASAVGIYGDQGDTLLTEQSPAADDFLAQLCNDWEASTHKNQQDDCRVILLRLGVVFSQKAEAWRKMKTPFSLGLGGRLGNGQQWLPWVHIQDVIDAIIFLSQHPTAEGAFNIVAPTPVRNREFTKSLGAAMKRPTLFPVPKFILRLLLGEFSSALLSSQRATPENLQKAGYQWKYPELKDALKDLL